MDRSQSSGSVAAGRIRMHQATESDLDFVAERYGKIAGHMKPDDQEFRGCSKRLRGEATEVR